MEEPQTPDSFRWTDDLVTRLIQLRYERREEFKTPGRGGSTRDCWLKILQDLHLDNTVTALQARKKWNHLMHKFREIENRIAVGSGSEELSWPHYNQMQTIMNELSVFESPSILATGNDNETVKIQFSDLTATDSLSNDEDLNESRAAKRDRRDIIDERFISAVEESNQQLKAIHHTLEKQNEAFLELMSRFINVIESQVPDDMM